MGRVVFLPLLVLLLCSVALLCRPVGAYGECLLPSICPVVWATPPPKQGSLSSLSLCVCVFLGVAAAPHTMSACFIAVCVCLCSHVSVSCHPCCCWCLLRGAWTACKWGLDNCAKSTLIVCLSTL